MRAGTMTAVALLAAVGVSPVMAQGGGGNMGGMRMGGGRAGDPTTQVMGTGELPSGWMMRFDPTRGNQPAPTAKDIKFVTMGTGYHFTSGPAAIYYNPKDMAKGEFSVSATFTQAKSMEHEAFGLFIGGTNLQDSTQNYLYLVVRPLDGAVQVKHRVSNARPNPGETMTPNAAVNKDDAKDGHATNKLTIHVAKDSVHFLVNDKLVQALSKAQAGASTDGQVGIRINHNIDIHVQGFAVTK